MQNMCFLCPEVSYEEEEDFVKIQNVHVTNLKYVAILQSWNIFSDYFFKAITWSRKLWLCRMEQWALGILEIYWQHFNYILNCFLFWSKASICFCSSKLTAWYKKTGFENEMKIKQLEKEWTRICTYKMCTFY